MPRPFRQSPLNSICEGSGNIICLDVLRALTRTSETKDALVAALESGSNRLYALDLAIDRTKSALSKPQEEAEARRPVETMALTLQGVALVQSAPGFVVEAFCRARLGDHSGFAYGALPGSIATDELLNRVIALA
jgi:putative acyl-CoA dehydrogenase